jgi:hypothetical protein
VRDLYLDARNGFYGQYYPDYPADYRYPWGEGRDLEMAIFADLAVRLVKGGTDQPAEAP